MRITQGRAQPQRWLADLEVPARSISKQGKLLPLTRQQRFEDPVSPEAAVISVFQDQWRKGLMHESGRWLQPPEFSRLGDFENGVGIGVCEAKAKAVVQSARPGALAMLSPSRGQHRLRWEAVLASISWSVPQEAADTGLRRNPA